VNKEVDPGLIATLKQDVIPWLEGNVAGTPEQQRRLAEDPRAHWFTMVLTRGEDAKVIWSVTLSQVLCFQRCISLPKTAPKATPLVG
jgi:hypothetical protein